MSAFIAERPAPRYGSFVHRSLPPLICISHYCYIISAPYICWLKGDMIITTMRFYLTAVSDVLGCNRRSARRPVLWPWWLLTPAQGEDEKLSWELVTTRSDVFDLIDLHTHTHTHAHRCTQTWRTEREEETAHKRITATDPDVHRPDVRKCGIVIH